MAVEARQDPKFPWDYDVPDTPYWNSLDYRLGRAFLSCYTQAEIAEMEFDDALFDSEKLKSLDERLASTFAAKSSEAAPEELRVVDYDSWNKLKMAQGGIKPYQGQLDAAEALTIEMYHNGPGGTKNMSALHGLSALQQEMGKYAEAEASAKEVLPWLQGHALLGHDSPQALACMRTLMKSTWKQGKYDEAEDWIKKCRTMIENLGKGIKFAKYEAGEEEVLNKDLDALRSWKTEGDVVKIP